MLSGREGGQEAVSELITEPNSSAVLLQQVVVDGWMGISLKGFKV